MSGNPKWLLILYIAIYTLVAFTTAYFLYQNQVNFWKAEACNTFTEALKEEVQKRIETKVCFLTRGNENLTKDQEGQIVVTIDSGYNKKEVSKSLYKHRHNIDSNSMHRGLHTELFAEVPLKADSLNLVWSNLLEKIGFRGKNMICLSTTDNLNRETKTYSKDSVYISKSDSLISYYIGCRCEIGVTAFIYYPWWKVFSVKDISLLSCIGILCILLFVLFEKKSWIYHRFLVKEVKTIIRQEVLVKSMQDNETNIYKIGDILFDTNTNILKRGDVQEVMFPQAAKLLKGFLDAKDYQLSTVEVQELLWGKYGTDPRMHTAIKRLRVFLNKCTNWTIENGNSVYQLKIPHFTEDNPLLTSDNKG